MILYEGERLGKNGRGECFVKVVEEDGAEYPLRAAESMLYSNNRYASVASSIWLRPNSTSQVAFAARKLFDWGYMGSLASNLSLSLLTDYLKANPDEIPEEVVYYFKKDVVSQLDDYCWTLPSSEIGKWLNSYCEVSGEEVLL